MTLARFRPRLLDALREYNGERLTRDVAAGITVGVVALPLAIAFAVASGVKPEQGLITAIVGGFLIAALGGSSVQISGPAGAFVVIVYGIVTRYGLTNLLISTVLAGVLLFLLGLFRLGALVRHIPVSVVIGFTNAIAVLIALSQLRDALGLRIEQMPADTFGQVALVAHHASQVNVHALLLAGLSVLLLFVWPRLFARGSPLPGHLLEGRTLRSAARIPAPVVVLVALTLMAYLLEMPVETVGSRFGGIPQVLPTLSLPPFTWDGALHLAGPTLTIALLGAVESLLCARVADNLGPHPRHDPNQELMAQGIANVIVPAFGGLPVTGTLARSVTNVRAGATSPVAGMVHALTLLVIVLVAAPLALHVPLPVLAGILLFVAWNMGEWHEFARLWRFSLAYRTVLLVTFALTVVFDLSVGVEVGLALACVFFIYRMNTIFRLEPQAPPDAPAGVQVLKVQGVLFFGTADKFEAVEPLLPPGTRTLVLEAGGLVAMDASGLEALAQLHRHLVQHGVRLTLAGLNEQPLAVLRRSGLAAELGDEGVAPTLADALRGVATAAGAPQGAAPQDAAPPETGPAR